MFHEVKGVMEKIICQCTRKPVRMQNFKYSTGTVIELRFFMKKIEENEEDEEDEESVEKLRFTRC